MAGTQRNDAALYYVETGPYTPPHMCCTPGIISILYRLNILICCFLRSWIAQTARHNQNGNYVADTEYLATVPSRVVPALGIMWMVLARYPMTVILGHSCQRLDCE